MPDTSDAVSVVVETTQRKTTGVAAVSVQVQIAPLVTVAVPVPLESVIVPLFTVDDAMSAPVAVIVASTVNEPGVRMMFAADR